MRVQRQIEERIRRNLAPEFLHIVNESSKHRVPDDAETHFDVTIVSDHFADTRLLERHRQVQKLLADELAGPVHALSLHTYTSGEWQQSGRLPPSPPAPAEMAQPKRGQTSARFRSLPQPVRCWLKRERARPCHLYGAIAKGDSPFGKFTAAFSKKGLAALFFGDPGFCLDELRRQDALNPSATWFEDKAVAAELSRRLFNQPDAVSQVRLHVIGTPLQLQVWQALLDIAPGQTISYTDLATALGRPSAVRAVASAVGANPVSWLIPCHRVVGRDGSLRGYRWGLERKKQMLAWEEQMKVAS